MRRYLKYVILLLALLSPALVLAQSGQEDEATDRAETRQKPVTFVAIMPEGSHLTDQQKLALQNKVERIIAKNKVGAGAGTTLFGIKADLDVKDTKRSAGLVRDVTVLSAEVTFTAVNTVDGSVYYSQSVSLQTDVVGDKEKAMDHSSAASVSTTLRSSALFAPQASVLRSGMRISSGRRKWKWS